MTKGLNEYFKGLSPELQEKARACKSAEELLKLADENDIELPQEALEAVSGGSICDTKPVTCPKCGSTNVTVKYFEGIVDHKCNSCKYNW